MRPRPPFIVAEVSKNWIAGQSPSALLLAQQFEHVINANLARGYLLHTFQLHRVMVDRDRMNETIIAVFRATPSDAP
jgi:hypothetical protein